MQMKKFKLIFLAFTLPILMGHCRKTSGNCESGTLYYLPNCATIKGYVVLDNGNVTKVFRNTPDPKYQGSGIRVCITYTVDVNQAVTADCIGGSQAIIITSIKDK
jgi:hypothetical protein